MLALPGPLFLYCPYPEQAASPVRLLDDVQWTQLPVRVVSLRLSNSAYQHLAVFKIEPALLGSDHWRHI